MIKNDRGLCHIYAHEDADLNMAADILENAKKQRPGVCNSVETLLIHEKIAPAFLPKLYERLSGAGVENPVAWFACAQTKQILQNQPNVQSAQNNSWDTEYLDYKLNCKVVMNLEETMEHIAKHGSKHPESILTANEETARQFQNQIDAAAVYWNASTRFTDGFMMGLGGEIGISTQKLHVRRTSGFEGINQHKMVIDGKGQIRK